MALDPTAPITRLTGIELIPGDNPTSTSLFYPPNLTTSQIAAIPVDTVEPGAVVFNIESEELLTLSAAGFWIPFLTEGSDINVVDLDVTGVATIATANVTTLNGATASLVNADITNGTITTLTSGLSKTTMLAGITVNSGVSPLGITLDTGAGTGATAVITGSAMSGQFQLNAGTSPAMGGIIGVFSVPPSIVSQFDGNFGAIFYPASATTSTIVTYATTSSPSGQILFGLGGGSTLVTGQYFWNYIIIGTKKSA